MKYPHLIVRRRVPEGAPQEIWCIAIVPDWEYQLECVMYAMQVSSSTLYDNLDNAVTTTALRVEKVSFATCEEKFYMPKFWKYLIKSAEIHE
jgi:hypothetical protein